MSRQLKKGDLVMVRTLDIEHDDFGWEPSASVAKRKMGRYHFVGWVIALKRHYIVVSSVLSSQGSTFCSVRLPRSAGMKVTRVTRVRRLR